MTGLVCLPITLATPVRTPSISRGVFCADTGADHAVAFMCARLVMSATMLTHHILPTVGSQPFLAHEHAEGSARRQTKMGGLSASA